MLVRICLLAVLVLGSGCTCNGAESPSADTSASTEPAAAASGSASAQPSPPPKQGFSEADRAKWQDCRKRIDELKKQQALPGAPEYEKQRVYMAGVRGPRLLWRRAPVISEELKQRLKKHQKPLAAVRGLLGSRALRSKDKRREILLAEGYIYAERPTVGLALVEQTSLTDLFDEAKIYLQRGVEMHELKLAERTRYLPKRYVHTKCCDETDRRAEVLLGDRVAATKEELTKQPALGIDLLDMQQSAGFDRLRPIHLTDQALVADLRYGPDTWVPSVWTLEGAKATLSCEALDDKLADARQSFIDRHQLRRKALSRLRAVVKAEVRAEIPFDADTGQTNGFLRREWKRAYFNGLRRFTVDDKKYDVYSTDGEPIPPQVCIDFLTDTWERAAGSWFAPLQGDPPRPKPLRTEGAIDFSKLGSFNRRSVAEFADIAKRHPDIFDVWEVPMSKRIAFKKRKEFFDFLAEIADQIWTGDMVSIHGYKEGGRPHYHSVFILEKDPITGVPVLVAGNAVLPREQTIEGVMQISPQRSWRHRFRILDPWLKHVVDALEANKPI